MKVNKNRFEAFQKRKTALLYAAVTPNVKQNVKRLVNAMGITVSEYIRNLVIQDLDRRSIFTKQVKRGG